MKTAQGTRPPGRRRSRSRRPLLRSRPGKRRKSRKRPGPPGRKNQKRRKRNAVPGGGSLTAFERLCDNAVMGYLAQARRIPFGEHPIIGYLYAREAEITAIRTIMSGRMAGLSGEKIRERLREAYV